MLSFYGSRRRKSCILSFVYWRMMNKNERQTRYHRPKSQPSWKYIWRDVFPSSLRGFLDLIIFSSKKLGHNLLSTSWRSHDVGSSMIVPRVLIVLRIWLQCSLLDFHQFWLNCLVHEPYVWDGQPLDQNALPGSFFSDCLPWSFNVHSTFEMPRSGSFPIVERVSYVLEIVLFTVIWPRGYGSTASVSIWSKTEFVIEVGLITIWYVCCKASMSSAPWITVPISAFFVETFTSDSL